MSSETRGDSAGEAGESAALQARIAQLEQREKELLEQNAKQKAQIDELTKAKNASSHFQNSDESFAASRLAKFFRQTPEERQAYVNNGVERVEILRLELDTLTEAESSASKRLQQVIRRVREFDHYRTALDTKLQSAQGILLKEFEEKADQLNNTFDMYRRPHDTALTLLSEHLVTLMEGKLFEMIAPSQLNNVAYTMYLAQVRGASESTNDLSALASGAAGDANVNMGLPATPANVTAELQSVTENEKIAKRWQVASDVLYPMFPSVDLESLVTMLETHEDNVEKTIVRLLDQENAVALAEAPASPESPESALRNGTSPPAPDEARKKPIEVKRSESEEQKGGSLVRSTSADTNASNSKVGSSSWLASLPRVIAMVLKVRPDLDLEVRLVLDRNGVPVDPLQSPVHVLHALTFFYDLGCRLLKGPEREKLADRYLDAKVPVITFEPNGPTTFSLLGVNPRIPLSQYRMEYSPDERDILALSHVEDGPVRFTAYNPKSLRPAPASQFENIVEVFTHAMPNGVVNIAHIHLETGEPPSEGELHVVYEKIVPSKANVYHLQIQNQNVVGLSYLLRTDTGVTELKYPFFLERKLPKAGSYVYIDEQSQTADAATVTFQAIARLEDIMLGIPADEAAYRNRPTACACTLSGAMNSASSLPLPIVRSPPKSLTSPSASPPGSLTPGDKQNASAGTSPADGAPDYGRTSPGSMSSHSSRSTSFKLDRCRRVQMKSMPGLARVIVLYENGAVVKPPRRETVHVCKLREADEKAVMQFMRK